jgi:hypothetical protein
LLALLFFRVECVCGGDDEHHDSVSHLNVAGCICCRAPCSYAPALSAAFFFFFLCAMTPVSLSHFLDSDCVFNMCVFLSFTFAAASSAAVCGARHAEVHAVGLATGLVFDFPGSLATAGDNTRTIYYAKREFYIQMIKRVYEEGEEEHTVASVDQNRATRNRKNKKEKTTANNNRKLGALEVTHLTFPSLFLIPACTRVYARLHHVRRWTTLPKGEAIQDPKSNQRKQCQQQRAVSGSLSFR